MTALQVCHTQGGSHIKASTPITIAAMKRITPKTIKAIIEYNGPIEAPIKKGDKVALLKVYISGDLHKQIDLFSLENIKKSNIFSRLLTSLNYLVWGDV